jgi:hypothetical protein
MKSAAFTNSKEDWNDIFLTCDIDGNEDACNNVTDVTQWWVPETNCTRHYGAVRGLPITFHSFLRLLSFLFTPEFFLFTLEPSETIQSS